LAFRAWHLHGCSRWRTGHLLPPRIVAGSRSRRVFASRAAGLSSFLLEVIAWIGSCSSYFRSSCLPPGLKPLPGSVSRSQVAKMLASRTASTSFPRGRMGVP
jgi:hypothetical protein